MYQKCTDGKLAARAVRAGARVPARPGVTKGGLPKWWKRLRRAPRAKRTPLPSGATPVPATVLILVVGVVLMVALPGASLLKLITASTILPAIIYGATIVLYLAVRRRLDRKKGAFDLGRFELPVAVCALVWTLVSLVVLVSPSEALVPVLIVVGLLVTGGAFFVGLLLFNRPVLENEPGDVSVFEH
ncbi:amino acid permease [Streptomyces ossamyceticus]|nr:amino acid permease [Streptomyces ossamyceticus]